MKKLITKDPLVSVLMTVHSEPILQVRKAIQSILSQTYTNFEFIIIIDSPEADILKNEVKLFAKEDDRIKIYQNEINLGMTKSLNKMLSSANGKYFIRMDSDDISTKDRIEKQVNFMEENPDIVLCGSQGNVINEQGNIIGKKIFPTTHIEIWKKLLWNNQMIHSAWCGRLNVVLSLGGYNETFIKSQDYELLTRIASKYSVANLDETLVSWRLRRGSLSWVNKRQEKDALRVRIKAVFYYGHSFFRGMFYIFLRFCWLALPQSFKRKRYAS